MTTDDQQRPIIIAGAGPCGLVAALTLQRENDPFVIIERARRDRLCSNVGSGFDLAPTAIDILRNRLKLPVGRIFQTYEGMRLTDMDGSVVKESPLSEMKAWVEMVTVNRADMQTLLLEELFRGTSSEDDRSETLRCGVEVVGFETNEAEDSVSVSLGDGTTLVGRALLGCDGIHSSVRKCMFRDRRDELQFCGATCWWGKTDIEPGSDLENAIDATQTFQPKGSSFLWALGSHRWPGSFMGAPVGGKFIWAFFAKSDEAPVRAGDDLTRRGGTTLDENSKRELADIVSDRADLIRLAVDATPPPAITKVGLYDRGDDPDKVPYVSGNVALLGDAAHPQSPFMGQGVNMAIADAYVCAMRLAMTTGTSTVGTVLAAYDSPSRRREVDKVVKQARMYGDISVSESRFVTWLFRASIRWLPLSWAIRDMMDGDRSNSELVRALDSDLSAIRGRPKKRPSLIGSGMIGST